MTYKFEVSDTFRSALDRIARKDQTLAAAVGKKMLQITSLDESGVNHYKNLRGSMSDCKRVQVGSFVITFTVKDDTIIFQDLDHHDRIYTKH